MMIKFVDLSRQHGSISFQLNDAFNRVLDKGRYVLGEEVQLFEKEFASFCQCGYGVGVASGTDAILIALKALGVGEGDEVLVPAFTAPPTVMAVTLSGARPVLVDIGLDGFTMDPAQAKVSITPRTAAIVPVHLYGISAPMEEIMELARDARLPVVEDACQAHGARLKSRPLGAWGKAGCFSFYPTKNLGALGDGGMIVTDDPELAREMARIRDYGREGRDLFLRAGFNSRLDELQAAFLRVKLRALEEGNQRRRELASRYIRELEGLPLRLPQAPPEALPAYHLFVVATQRRDQLSAFLASRNIETLVHYPHPIHLQPAFAYLGYGEGDFPNAERAAKEVLSLPLYPELEDEEVEEIVSSVKDFFSM